MATVATRAPKRELAPDWRDALGASRAPLRRAQPGARCSSALSLGGALALATHSPTDPSLSTAAGGPPANWLGATGAYFSDALLLLFGLGAVLFFPVIAIAGLRMLRLEPAGRIGRGLLLAAIGAVLIGVALGLTSGSAVSGPARRLGRSARACRRAWRRCRDRPDPQPADRWPDAFRQPAAVRDRRPRRRLCRARAHRRGACVDCRMLKRQPRERRAAAAPDRDRGRRRSRDCRRAAALAPGGRGGRTARELRSSPRARAPGRKSQTSLALGDSYVLPTIDLLARAAGEGQAADRSRRARAQRAPARKRARGFPRPRRHRRGSPRSRRHDVRARAGKRDQGQPRDPACRRHRPQHVGAVGARRDHSRPQRDRHRAAQSQARDGRLCAS